MSSFKYKIKTNYNGGGESPKSYIGYWVLFEDIDRSEKE